MTKKKRIAIIGTVGVPARYGGFETLAQYLTEYLGESYDLTVYCSSKSYQDQLPEFNGAKLVYLPLHANGIQSILYDIFAISRSVGSCDVMLILGVSGCFILPIVKLFFNGKIIVNIDGLEWRREKWSGFPGKFLRFSEWLAVCFSDVVVADNKVIQDYIASAYQSPSKLIAYGADHARMLPLNSDLTCSFPFLEHNYAFSVCRIEPENNIHVILDGAANFPDLHLVLVGNWSASAYGIDLKDRYSKYQHLHLLNPIYDQESLDRIRSNCKVYVHGHSAGGTNPSLVEAMYLRLPVIAYDVNYNRETTENKAIYFSDPMSLTDIFSSLDKLDIKAVADNMCAIASRRYIWADISKDYADVFE